VSSFEDLAEVVAPQVLLDAIRVGDRLTELGVPHALIGGLAVGLNGHPRATKDVDYMVGPEAFETTEPLLVYREELKDVPPDQRPGPRRQIPRAPRTGLTRTQAAVPGLFSFGGPTS